MNEMTETPPTITDKREQKRLAAETARLERRAELRQAMDIKLEERELDVVVLPGAGEDPDQVALCRFCLPEGGEHEPACVTNLSSVPADPPLRYGEVLVEQPPEGMTERQMRIAEIVAKGRTLGPDSLTEDERAELLRLQAQEMGQASEKAIEGMTAFYVIVGHDGDVVCTPDVNAILHLTRTANTQDMFGACSIVLKDIQASQTSAAVMARMQGVMQQAQARIRPSGPVGRRGGS
jgi:hypothetical protein